MYGSNLFIKELLEVATKIVSQSQAELYQRTSAYIAIAEAYKTLGKSKSAKFVVESFLALNQECRNSDYDSLEEISSYHLRKGDRTKAIEFLNLAFISAKKKSDYEERDDVLVRFGERFAAAGKVIEALECAELIEDDYDEGMLYRSIACHCISNRQEQELNNIIERAKKTGWENWLLEDIVESYLEYEYFPQALNAVEMMNQEQAKVNALSNIARKYYETGNKAEATKNLSKAQAIANKIEDSAAKSWSLQVISQVSQIIGNHVRTDSLLSDSVEEAKSIDDVFLQGFAFNNLAFQLASAEKYQEAIEIIESSNQFIPKFQKIRLLISVLEQYQKADYSEKAQEIIDIAIKTVSEITGSELSISDEDARSFAWNDIADYALKHKQFDLACKICSKIKTSDGKTNLLIKISNIYLEENNYELAQNTLNKAMKTLPRVNSNISLSYSMAIADGFARLNNYYSAIQAVKLIPVDVYQAQTITKIALQYAKSLPAINRETFNSLKTLI